MNPLGHLSFPALLFIIGAELLKIDYSFLDLLILFFFSILPDFDLLFVSLLKKEKFDFSFLDLIGIVFLSALPGSNFLYQRFSKKKKTVSLPKHRDWLTHQPIIYLPLVGILLLNPNFKLFLICFGLYFHLVLDSFWGRGIKWLFPCSQKLFNFGPLRQSFKEYRAYKDPRFYQKTLIYKAELSAFLILLFVLTLKLINYLQAAGIVLI